MRILRLLKVLSITALLLVAATASAEVPVPHPQVPEGVCVAPVDVMRRDHMEFILHQRDETTEKGIRTSEHSLKQCVSCHAIKDDKGEYIRVDDPSNKHFCASCHEYAAVKIDCFQCHADTPKSTDIHELRVNE